MDSPIIHRRLTARILQDLAFFPAIAIIGPRQAGKTTLARHLSAPGLNPLYLDLERPSDLALLEDAEWFLRRQKDRCVILDEIQHRPDLFPLLRSLIDEDRRPGRFILLGSASPNLLRQASDSLAGRIAYHTLTPFLVTEILSAGHDIAAHWFRGGFPPAFLASSDEDAFRWLEAFVVSYTDRELPRAYSVHPPSPSLMRRFAAMLAHHHTGLWNASEFGRSLGISSPTASRYLDLWEESFLVRRLTPWTPNLKKRLVKSPKVYLRDTGILHALLGIRDARELPSRVQAGASWEGYVVEQTASVLPPTASLHYYRTVDGTECDMVVVRDGRPVLLAEVKLSAASANTRGLTVAMKDLDCERAFVITQDGPEDEEIRPGIRLCDLPSFLRTIRGENGY